MEYYCILLYAFIGGIESDELVGTGTPCRKMKAVSCDELLTAEPRIMLINEIKKLIKVDMKKTYCF